VVVVVEAEGVACEPSRCTIPPLGGVIEGLTLPLQRAYARRGCRFRLMPPNRIISIPL
jgi:hypothetical protein